MGERPPGIGMALRLCGMAAVLHSAACYMPLAAGEHLQVEMAALRHDMGTLERRLAESSAGQTEQMQELRGQVATLDRTVGKMVSASRVADADMGSQLERMVQDVQMLRGAVEDNAHQLGEAQSQQNKLTQELTARLAAIAPSAQTPGKERASLSVATQKAMPTGKKELLAYGQKLLGSAPTQEDGRNVLREVSRKYAADRGVGDEALYALGTSFMAEKKYDLAQRDLIRLVDAQPKSPLVAAAFMKLAECSLALGRLEDAQTFLGEVVSNHRQSKVYRAARAKLAEVTLQLTRGKMPQKASSPSPAKP